MKERNAYKDNEGGGGVRKMMTIDDEGEGGRWGGSRNAKIWPTLYLNSP